MHDKINSESEWNIELKEISGLSYQLQMSLNLDEQVQEVVFCRSYVNLAILHLMNNIDYDQPWSTSYINHDWSWST